jgi:hypothetical protein
MKVEKAGEELLNVAEMSASGEILKRFTGASLGLCGQKLTQCFYRRSTYLSFLLKKEH